MQLYLRSFALGHTGRTCTQSTKTLTAGTLSCHDDPVIQLLRETYGVPKPVVLFLDLHEGLACETM